MNCYQFTKPGLIEGILIFTLLMLSACGGGGGGGGKGGGAGSLLVLSIVNSQVSLAEGDAGSPRMRFEIRLDKAADSDVTVEYATHDDSATAPADFTALNNTLTLPGGQTSATIHVEITPELCFEQDESFNLTLSNISSAATLDSSYTATGTISNDDEKRVLTLQGAAQDEGDVSNTMVFNAQLDSASCQDITVRFDTIDGGGSNTDQTDSNDLTHQSNQILTMPAGMSQSTLEIEISGDVDVENDEAFTLQLSDISSHAMLATGSVLGLIMDDDDPNNQTGDPDARLTIADAGIDEGDSGSVDLVFTVSLTEAVTGIVTVDYETDGNSTATQGVDYTASSGTLTFNSGEREQSFPVPVIGDDLAEGDEIFRVRLSNVIGEALIGDSVAAGIIRGDDGEVALSQLSISDVSQLESNSTVSGDWDPSIATLDNGDAISIWRDSPVFESTVYSGGSWSDTPVISSSTRHWDLQLAGSASGTAFVTWAEDRRAISWVARYDPVTGWGSPVQLQPDPADPAFADAHRADVPLIDVDPSGNAMVIWLQAFSNGSSGGAYYRYYDAVADTWSDSSLVADTSLATFPQQIALYGKGDAVLVEPGRGRGFIQAWFYDRASDQWTLSSDIGSSNQAASPQVVFDANDNLFLVWSTQDSFDIYTNRFDDQAGTWGTPQLMSIADGSSGVFPKIATDDAGNAIVVWHQDINNASLLVPAQYRIRASRFSASDGQWSPTH